MVCQIGLWLRYTKSMSKQKKKRNKKYQGAEAQTKVHSFTAEELELQNQKKKRKKWMIIAAVVGAPILLILELII